MTGSDVQHAATAAPQAAATHTVTLTLASGLTVHVAHRQDVDGEAIVIEAPQGSGGFHPTWAATCAARLVDGAAGTFKDHSDPLDPASVTLHPACLTLSVHGGDVTLHVTPADRQLLADAITAVAAATPERVA